MATEWFVRLDGKACGPISSAELKRRAENGELAPDTPISKCDNGSPSRWVHASRVQGLLPEANGQPSIVPQPPPAAAVPTQEAITDVGPTTPLPPISKRRSIPSTITEQRPRKTAIWILATALGISLLLVGVLFFLQMQANHKATKQATLAERQLQLAERQLQEEQSTLAQVQQALQKERTARQQAEGKYEDSRLQLERESQERKSDTDALRQDLARQQVLLQESAKESRVLKQSVEADQKKRETEQLRIKTDAAKAQQAEADRLARATAWKEKAHRSDAAEQQFYQHIKNLTKDQDERDAAYADYKRRKPDSRRPPPETDPDTQRLRNLHDNFYLKGLIAWQRDVRDCCFELYGNTPPQEMRRAWERDWKDVDTLIKTVKMGNTILYARRKQTEEERRDADAGRFSHKEIPIAEANIDAGDEVISQEELWNNFRTVMNDSITKRQEMIDLNKARRR